MKGILCYSHIIKLPKGYWRSSNESDEIIYCYNNAENCVGDLDNPDINNYFYCKEGTIGALCEDCDL